jgi:hypothetical protein
MFSHSDPPGSEAIQSRDREGAVVNPNGRDASLSAIRRTHWYLLFCVYDIVTPD